MATLALFLMPTVAYCASARRPRIVPKLRYVVTVNDGNRATRGGAVRYDDRGAEAPIVLPVCPRGIGCVEPEGDLVLAGSGELNHHFPVGRRANRYGFIRRDVDCREFKLRQDLRLYWIAEGDDSQDDDRPCTNQGGRAGMCATAGLVCSLLDELWLTPPLHFTSPPP